MYVWYASLDYYPMAFISHAGRPAAAVWLQCRFRKCGWHKNAGHSRQVEGAYEGLLLAV